MKRYVRWFYCFLLLACISSYIYFSQLILTSKPWPDADSYYTDTKAVQALAIFVNSSCFFSILFAANHFFAFSDRLRALISRLIDFVWYPSGMIAVLIALSTTSKSTLLDKKTQIELTIGNHLSTVNSNLFNAKETCGRYLDEKIALNSNSPSIYFALHKRYDDIRLFRFGLSEPVFESKTPLNKVLGPFCEEITTLLQTRLSLALYDVSNDRFVAQACGSDVFGNRIYYSGGGHNWYASSFSIAPTQETLIMIS